MTQKRQITRFLGSHYLFVLLVGFYLVMVLHHLNLPYFWDASWVYAPAIQAMVAHGPSLLSDAIPPDLSRGHPLLFHFIASIWLDIWGNNLIAVHTLMLLISAGVLFLTYAIGRDGNHPNLGTLAAAILVCQELFLAQATQCLPEGLLTLFVLLSYWFYRKQQWIGYVIGATAMLYTKESGLVFILALALYTFISYFLGPREIPWIKLMRRLAVIALPVLFASLHYLWLKHRFDWYFYPLHINYFKTSWQDFHNDLRNIWRVLWTQDGRLWISIAAGVAILWQYGRAYWKWTLALVVLTYLGLITFYRQWPQPTFWLKIVALLGVVAICLLSLYLLHRNKEAKAIPNTAFSLVYLTLFSLFSAYNVFTIRYLHNLFPFYALITAWGLGSVLKKQWQVALSVVLILGYFTFVIYPQPKTGISDVKLNFADGLSIQQQLIDSIYVKGYTQEKIHASLLEMVAGGHDYLGFLKGRDPIPNMSFNLDSTTQVALYTNIAQEPTYQKMTEMGFRKLFRIQQGDAWGEMWAKK